MSEAKLLTRIAAIPPGEKLPLARFSRELNCSQSVIMTMVERLIDRGSLARETLRPFEVKAEMPPSIVGTAAIERDHLDAWLYVGAEYVRVGETLKAIVKARGMTFGDASMAIFGNSTQLSSMPGQPGNVGKKVVSKIRAWLTGAPLPQATEQGRAAVPPRGADAGVVCSERSTPAKPDGEALYEELVAAAKRIGITLNRLATAIWPISPGWKLEQLRIAKHPRAATITRIRDAIRAAEAGEELPGLALRNPTQAEAVAVTAKARETEELRREAAERAQETRRPGETLAQAVKRECDETAARRLRARVAGGGIRPVDLSEDDEGDEEAGSFREARRQREMRELSTPSALIRKANEEWPERCAKVAALSVQLGVKLGEAWDQVIGAGILAVEEDLAEEMNDERRAA